MIKLGGYFETKTRASGEDYVTLKDDSPKWLLDAIRDAHQGTMPNDWIYTQCRAACQAIDDGSLGSSGDIIAFTDGYVDVYTKDLYQWAADLCLTSTWSNAEAESNELDPLPSNEDRIRLNQYCAIRYIAEVVWNAYKANS